MSEKQQKVITVEGAMQLIGCSRTMLYTKHLKNLTKLEKIGKRVHFDLTEVTAYSKKIKGQTANYDVVTVIKS